MSASMMSEVDKIGITCCPSVIFSGMFAGMWQCDMGHKKIQIPELCKEYQCQDQTDASFCECGRGKWKCPVDGKCIKDNEVCDRNKNGCDCVQCSDEEENFCSNIW